jgi:hypothetical protein
MFSLCALRGLAGEKDQIDDKECRG